jgi:N,N-dimethylformamidase beta subunit-like protein
MKNIYWIAIFSVLVLLIVIRIVMISQPRIDELTNVTKPTTIQTTATSKQKSEITNISGSARAQPSDSLTFTFSRINVQKMAGPDRSIWKFADWHTKGGYFGFPDPSRNGIGNRVAVVKPTFTAAAYNNAFYSWYGLVNNRLLKAGLLKGEDCRASRVGPNGPCIPVASLKTPDINHFTVGKIPVSTSSYIMTTPKGPQKMTQFGAYDMLKIVPHLEKLASSIPRSSVTTIDDGYIDGLISGAVLRQRFDIIILGHNEYATAREYSNLQGFVHSGGTLILLDGNVFYGEVAYDPVNATVQFIRGHNYAYDPRTGTSSEGGIFERWFNQTKEWIGGNYLKDIWVHDLPNNTFVASYIYYGNNPFSYKNHEQELVNNNVNVIQDYGARYVVPAGTDPKTFYPPFPQPIVATYQKPYGQGQSIVFGLYSDELLGSPKFLNFFDQVFHKLAITRSK